jgi:hypothetical protein
MKKVLSLVFSLVILAACRKEYYGNDDFTHRPAYTYSGKQVRDYFTLLCKISKTTPGFFPPQVARAYGYVGIANYEAVLNGISGAQSLAGQISGLSATDLPKITGSLQYDWSIASNTATAEMIRKMFERKITVQNVALIDSTEQANLKELSAAADPDVVNRSVQFGKAVAAAIYNYSINDGGHLSYLDPFQLPYTMPTDAACWVPTGAVTTPVSPRWGENRPYIPADVANALQYAPKQFSTNPSSEFYKEAMEVYNQVKVNSAEQIEIAKYWADDPFNTCTPTGHTFNIMTQLLEESKATLEKTSVAYAKLCVAENDAFVACWKGKYKYAAIRPVSYIRKYIDPSFNTVIGTPPFPAFTSGHSCEMGAAARVFTDLFTDGSGNYNFTDYSQLQYGFSPRSYVSFNQLAQECANSRFYGGIHFQSDNSKGLEIGKTIGDNVTRMISWPRNIR